MAEGKGTGRGSGGAGTKSAGEAGQPQGTDRLKEELQQYVEARVQAAVKNMGHRMDTGAKKLGEAHVGPGALTSAAARGARRVRDRLPGGEALSSTATHAKDSVVDKAKDVGQHGLGGARKKSQDKTPDAGGKGMTIIEDIDVGVPVRVAYDQWTQYQEFKRFTKGVVDVQQKDETTSNWHVKVAKASRRWQGTVTEQVPDERIAWTSEGPKGTTKGVVTFHPLGENLTKVLLVLRYFPQGPIERIGGLWRAQGRRARLDLKLYRSFVTMRGEATGSWRGEIRDSEVVRSDEEAREEDEERYDESVEGTEDDENADDAYDEEEAEEPEEDDWDEDEETDDEEDEYDDEDGGSDGVRDDRSRTS